MIVVADPLEILGTKGEGTFVSVEENKALARRFLEALVTGNLKVMDEVMAADFVSHDLLFSGQAPDREGVIWAMAQVSAAVSNASVRFEDQVAGGDKVVTRCVARVTHDRGELIGVAPSGQEMTNTFIVIHRIERGKIAEEWSIGTMAWNLRGQRLEQERIERERVEQELLVARSIQRASLPEEVPELTGWQISPYYQPARHVGGDFYDFFDLEEGRVGVAVGDATGKGMPAALAASATSSMLRAVAQALGSSSPGEVLEQVNDTLVSRIPPNMFVTCFYCILDPERGSLRYANAGHDLPYLRRRGGHCEELRARGMPLGLMPRMEYEEKEIVLDAGEGALFYSDGLVEAHDPKREMFGFPRLRGLVAEQGEDEMVVDLLLKELHSFVGEGWEQEDDITLLTLRRSGVSR
jgi:serine phosphatase RsbU (regulator of sigma subunit)/ketosteroid isomerase-like protein